MFWNKYYTSENNFNKTMDKQFRENNYDNCKTFYKN